MGVKKKQFQMKLTVTLETAQGTYVFRRMIRDDDSLLISHGKNVRSEFGGDQYERGTTKLEFGTGVDGMTYKEKKK